MCVFSLTTATGRLARWRLRLLEYDFEVMHRPGIVHPVPDAFPRLDMSGFDITSLEDEIYIFCVYLPEVNQLLNDVDDDGVESW